MLLAALEHLGTKIFRLLQIIPIVKEAGVLKNHEDGRVINLNFSLVSELLRQQ